MCCPAWLPRLLLFSAPTSASCQSVQCDWTPLCWPWTASELEPVALAVRVWQEVLIALSGCLFRFLTDFRLHVPGTFPAAAGVGLAGRVCGPRLPADSSGWPVLPGPWEELPVRCLPRPCRLPVYCVRLRDRVSAFSVFTKCFHSSALIVLGLLESGE